MIPDILKDLATVKALFQQRVVLAAMGVMQRDLLEPELEQCDNHEKE